MRSTLLLDRLFQRRCPLALAGDTRNCSRAGMIEIASLLITQAHPLSVFSSAGRLRCLCFTLTFHPACVV